MTEAEVRVGVIDSIVKGLARCTNTVLACEVSVKSSDAIDSSVKLASATASATITDTPQEQQNVSQHIVPDYTFYTLSEKEKCVCGIVEVKRKTMFHNDSVCQTIGYHLASRIAYMDAGMYSNTPDIHVCVQSHLLYCYTLKVQVMKHI